MDADGGSRTASSDTSVSPGHAAAPGTVPRRPERTARHTHCRSKPHERGARSRPRGRALARRRRGRPAGAVAEPAGVAGAAHALAARICAAGPAQRAHRVHRDGSNLRDARLGGWRRAGEERARPPPPAARRRLSRSSHCASRSLTLVRSSRSISRRRAMSSRASSSSRCFFASMRRLAASAPASAASRPRAASSAARFASTAPWLSARTRAQALRLRVRGGQGVDGHQPRGGPAVAVHRGGVSVSRALATSRLSAAACSWAAFASSSPVAVAPRGRSSPPAAFSFWFSRRASAPKPQRLRRRVVLEEQGRGNARANSSAKASMR